MLTYENAFLNYENVKSHLIVQGLMSGPPELSIVIPTYKRLNLLREAISSALGQSTSVSYEIIVVDNCQEPEAGRQVEEMIRAFGSDRISLYRNDENIGMFGNWNRCIELAKGQWLTILNDDDRLESDWIQTVWRYRSGRSLVGVGAQMIGDVPPSPVTIRVIKRIFSYFQSLSKIRKLSACDFFYGHPFYGSLGVLFEKNALLELGGYSEKYWPASDYILSYRYWLANGGRVVNRSLADYRWEDNASKRADVLAGFVVISYLVRTVMICRVKCRNFRRFANMVSSKKATVDALWIQLRFGVDIRAESGVSRFISDVPRKSKYRLFLEKVVVLVSSFCVCLIF